MILVDTNVLYTLADRRDKHRARCADWLQRTPDVLMVPATVLAETCYLIDRTLGPAAEAAFLDSVGTGPDYTFQLVELVDSDLRRMSGLVRQYADLRLREHLVVRAERANPLTERHMNVSTDRAIERHHDILRPKGTSSDPRSKPHRMHPLGSPPT